MGYNSKLTKQFFYEFVEDNKSKIEKVIIREHEDCIAYFKDGTVVITFGSLSHNRRRYKIDQILLVDDSRKEIYSKRADDIKFIRDYCMCITCIPEELQIIYMDVDSPIEG